MMRDNSTRTTAVPTTQRPDSGGQGDDHDGHDPYLVRLMEVVEEAVATEPPEAAVRQEPGPAPAVLRPPAPAVTPAPARRERPRWEFD